MGTHPIFESDFDCLTEDAFVAYSAIVAESLRLQTQQDQTVCAAIGGVGPNDQSENE